MHDKQVGEIPRFVNIKGTCEPLIDADEAASLLDVHPKTVKRLAAKGLIPGIKIGKLWRFRASLLDSWLASQLNLSRHPCPDTKGEE